jgi:hypothetical protein
MDNLDTTFRELNICSLTLRRHAGGWLAEALQKSNLERVRSNIHASSGAALEELSAMLRP